MNECKAVDIAKILFASNFPVRWPKFFSASQFFVMLQKPKLPSRTRYLIKSQCGLSFKYCKVTQCSCDLVKLTLTFILCFYVQIFSFLPLAQTWVLLKSGWSP